MFAPGMISFHVIIPASFVANVTDEPVGCTSAVPVIVTFPVANVNAFPVTEAVASAVTVNEPKPSVVAFPVTSKLESPLIVRVPRPKVNAFPVTLLLTASAMIPTLPIVIVSPLPVVDTITSESGPDVANGNADIASNPKLI